MSDAQIQGNLDRQLDPAYRPVELIIEELLLDAKSFDEAVDALLYRKVTSAGFLIVGGIRDNQGVVISRESEGTVNQNWLGLNDDTTNWFLVQTNKDPWRQDDKRYNTAMNNMEKLGRKGVSKDGTDIIEQVLWQPGVLQYDTIYTGVVTAASDT